MSENKEEIQFGFERLSPFDEAELDIYEHAINYALNESDIKNVAISGTYGAGKSSVLESYKKKNEGKKFLNISLAHFKSADKKSNEDVEEFILEGKILNQLIYQIPSDKIPLTNFKIKKEDRHNFILQIPSIVILFLITIYYFSHFNEWRDYVETLPNNLFKSVLSLLTHQYALMIDGLFIISLLSYIIYEVYSRLKNKNVFWKFTLHGNEIKICEENDDSYFDKYLNEVLYLFEKSDVDAIVFEDMDRFNASKIFEHLREINRLVNIKLKNNAKNEGDEKVLRFFYLLRDDIFSSKDRIKFFDYIIPIIPVIDSSNSYQKLISKFEKIGIAHKFNKIFLQKLSLYIDDMRLSKNICNEYIIYYDKLNSIELNCNKMLAIITYKNLFPQDFSNLQVNQGFIHAVFENKDKLTESKEVELTEKINESKGKIKLVNEVHLQSINELNVVIAHKYLKHYNWNKEDDDDLQNYITRYLNQSQLEDYNKRKQKLMDILNVNIAEMEDQIRKYEREILELKNRKLHKIINDDKEVFKVDMLNWYGERTDFKELKTNIYFDLLKFLIREGYIDKSYTDYMTYFYEGGLSRVDKIFLRSVMDKNTKGYSYNLNNPELVMDYLQLADFNEKETLNYDLLEYLLINDEDKRYTEYLDTLIMQVKDMKNLEFALDFFSSEREHEKFVRKLNEHWSNFFSMIVKKDAKIARQFSIDTLTYCEYDEHDKAIIENVNENNCLTKFISEYPNYLEIDNVKVYKLISGFVHIGVKFTSIIYKESYKELFEEVYANSLYVLNFQNIKQMIKYVNKDVIDGDIVHKNYTVIEKQNKELLKVKKDFPLGQYISENMLEYVNIILDNCSGSIADDEEYAISLLSYYDIMLKIKNKIN